MAAHHDVGPRGGPAAARGRAAPHAAPGSSAAHGYFSAAAAAPDVLLNRIQGSILLLFGRTCVHI